MTTLPRALPLCPGAVCFTVLTHTKLSSPAAFLPVGTLFLPTRLLLPFHFTLQLLIENMQSPDNHFLGPCKCCLLPLTLFPRYHCPPWRLSAPGRSFLIQTRSHKEARIPENGHSDSCESLDSMSSGGSSALEMSQGAAGWWPGRREQHKNRLCRTETLRQPMSVG